MSAEQSLREGKATEALEALQKRVKSNPSDAKERLFLFQLLAVLGQWERSANQLKVAGQLDASLLILVELYRHAIEAEGVRAKVFAGEATPVLMGEPSSWTAPLLEALRLDGRGASRTRGASCASRRWHRRRPAPAPSMASPSNGSRTWIRASAPAWN